MSVDQSLGEFVLTSFTWKINISCFDNKKLEDKIVSPKFYSTQSGEKINSWQLELYPKGRFASDEGHVSLFLKYFGDHRVDAEYSFSLLNQNNIKVDENFEMEEEFFHNKNDFGNSMFVKESFLMDPQNNILKDNIFTILCKIVTKDDKTFSESSDNTKLHQLQQFHKIKKLFTSGDHSDITISAEGKNFYLHKCILSINSPVFEAMFVHDMLERNSNVVEIKDVKYDVLKELFCFIYTGKAELWNIDCELLTAAEKYCVTDLKKYCEESMVINLGGFNFIKYLNAAIMSNAERLKTHIIKWISLHLDCVSKDPEFIKF